MMASLLRSLVALSEKAANLARIIRSEKALFELLVEEKTGEQKNKRFVRDFKTLGDVLIQEMIRHDIAQQVIIKSCLKGQAIVTIADFQQGIESVSLLKPLHNIGKTKKKKCSQIYT